jgi:hypothetical protein
VSARRAGLLYVKPVDLGNDGDAFAQLSAEGTSTGTRIVGHGTPYELK